MYSIGIKRTRFAILLAFIFAAVGLAEMAPLAIGQKSNPAPWRTIEWLTSRADVFCNAGRAWLTAKIDESVQTTGDYVGWGTGAGVAAVTDTTLFTEDTGGTPAYARVVATRSIITTTVTDDTVQWVASITSNGAKDITNAGNFTASTAGGLICKGDHASTHVESGDIIQYTITAQFT